MEPAVIIAVAIIGVFAVLGYRDGVIKRLVEVIGVVFAVVLTARFAARLTPWLAERTGWDEGVTLLAAWVAMIFVGLLLSRLLGVLVSKAVRLTILGWLDRIGGAVCGAVIGTVIASVIMIVSSQLPGGESLRTAFLRDPVGSFIYGTAPNLARQARLLAGDRFAELWDRATEAAADKADAATDEAKDRLDDARREGEERAREAAGR